jgi:hypothetical protein
MAAPIYLVGDDGSLIELQEQSYAAESLLQELLASYPKLLDGDRGGSGDRRWVLVTREASLPSERDGAGRWSVDHLFLDQEGIPTLVEVKRSSDTRIRREVVGQMLDYAANAVMYWPVEHLRDVFEANCEREGTSSEERLQSLVGALSPDEFWVRVKTNLQAGRVRMIFVADEIPSDLRRIVEFLNEQMDPAEVLAIEVRQFVGEGRRTLVPKTIGETAESEKRKATRSTGQRQWDEGTFMEELGRRSADEVAVARGLLRWANRPGMRIWWGKGKITGSMIPILDHAGDAHTLISAWTNGIVSIQFGYMINRPPFNDQALRRAFAKRLNIVPGVSIPEGSVDKFPSFPMVHLRDGDARSQFLEALDWAVEQIQTSGR